MVALQLLWAESSCSRHLIGLDVLTLSETEAAASWASLTASLEPGHLAVPQPANWPASAWRERTLVAQDRRLDDKPLESFLFPSSRA